MQQLKFNSLLTLSKLRATCQYFNEWRTLVSLRTSNSPSIAILWYDFPQYGCESFPRLNTATYYLLIWFSKKPSQEPVRLYPQSWPPYNAAFMRDRPFLYYDNQLSKEESQLSRPVKHVNGHEISGTVFLTFHIFLLWGYPSKFHLYWVINFIHEMLKIDFLC